MEWVVLLFVIVIFFIVLTKRVSGLAAQACSACADQGTSYRYKNSSDCSTPGCRCEQEACPSGSVRSSTDDKTCVPTSCPVGQTLSGNACVPCPAGTYKNNTGTGTCTPCTNSSTGRYVSAACTSTTDTQFSSWPSCRAGQHLEGYDLGSATSLGNPGHCENNNLANGQQCSSDVDCASGYCDTGGDNYYCRPKPPIDCAVSGWTNSGSCSATACGTTGTQKQTRTVTRQAAYGGTACPSLTQEVQCSGPPCPVDCQVSGWTNSGSCSATICGTTGTQKQTRTVTRQAAYGGTACPSLTQEVQCNGPVCVTCPADKELDRATNTCQWNSAGCTFPDSRAKKSDAPTKLSYCKNWCKGREADPCCAGLGMDSETLPSLLQGMCCAARGEFPSTEKKPCCTGLTRDDTGVCNPPCVPAGEATTTNRPYCCPGLFNGAVLGGVCSAPSWGGDTSTLDYDYGFGNSSYAVADF